MNLVKKKCSEFLFTGNDFHGISIQANGIIDRVKKQSYPFQVENDTYVLKSPDGYKFYINDAALPNVEDPVQKVIINTKDLSKTESYWVDVLKMNLIEKKDKEISLSYGDKQAKLAFTYTGNGKVSSIRNFFQFLIFLYILMEFFFNLDVPVDRKTAFGRIAFAIPFDEQTKLNDAIIKLNETVIHPLTSLDTPGKATVRVIILSDPNQLEICFVDEEGFSQLSQIDPSSDAALNKEISRDPFQPK